MRQLRVGAPQKQTGVVSEEGFLEVQKLKCFLRVEKKRFPLGTAKTLVHSKFHEGFF